MGLIGQNITADDWSKRTYVKADGGLYKTVTSGDSYGAARLKLGGIFQIGKGPTFDGSIGFGTDFNLKAKVNQEIKFNKKIGMDIYGEAEYNKRMAGQPVYITGEKGSTVTTYVDEHNDIQELEQSYDTSEKVRDGYKKAGAGFVLNFKGSRGKMGLGLEGGYRGNALPQSIPDDIKYSEKYKQVNESYITPVFKAEARINKDGNLIATIDTDKFGANIGIKYMF